MKIYENAQNIIITGVNEPIQLFNCVNVRVIGCKISNPKEVGIYLYNCTNVTIELCNLSLVLTGVRASRSTGVFVYRCIMSNMIGPKPDGQFVQFIECYGGNKIMNNTFTNVYGKGNPEDAINIYKSNGTKEAPIQIAYNKIVGGGPSATGGGICLGDDGGSWQEVFDNSLQNPGQYGIGAAGGHDISIYKNRVYAARAQFTNVGILTWNQYPHPSYNIRVFGNDVNWTHADGYRNDFWDGGNMGKILGQ